MKKIFLTCFTLYWMARLTSLHAAVPVVESFDQLPSADLWLVDKGVRVLDGEVILSARADSQKFATSAIRSKSGVALLDFTRGGVQLKFKDVSLKGTAAPENSVFMAIIASNIADEIRAESFLKLRLTSNGALILTCPGMSGGKVQEEVLARATVTLPIQSLELNLSSSGFALTGTHSGGVINQYGEWEGRLSLTAWQGKAPFLLLKAMRRPGEGEVVAYLGQVEINAR